MKQSISLSDRFTLPSAAMIVILTVYLALSVGLAFVMPFFPPLGLIGALVINLIVLFFVRSRLAFPLYIIVSGPSVAFSLSSSGILSHLYIGNMLFVLVVSIWILQTVLPQRKSGQRLIEPGLLAPFVAVIIIGLISIIYSRFFPDPNVPYVYPHSNAPLILVNLSEMAILIGLPMFLIVVPGIVRTVSDVRWVIGAYTFAGLMYALGTIFAAPLGLYSKEVILGIRRPEVFGSVSSALGTLILLFTSIAFGRALYSRTVRRRIFWGIFSLIFSIGVIMTLGRESWIGLFLTVLIMVAVRTKNWSVLLVLLAPLVLLLIPGVSDFFDPSKTYGSDRLKIWQDAIYIWQRSPYMGIGAGNYQFFDRFYGHDKVGIAHNQYLQFLAEMGVQGLLCIIWVIIVVGLKALKSFNTARTDLSKSIALAFLGFYVSLVVAGFFTGSFIPSAAVGGGTGPFVEASYRWLFLGLVLSAPKWEDEAKQLEEDSRGKNEVPAQEWKQEHSLSR